MEDTLINGQIEKNKKNIEQILEYIYDKTKFDFREYKHSTAFRRISRRFYYCEVDNFSQYFDYIIKNYMECLRLVNDLLISVTEFFRDREQWRFLYEKYLPEILQIKENKDCVRVWCAGCASGEEAYSLAIILEEIIEKYRLKNEYKIIATDIAVSHIYRAQSGIYKKESLKNLPFEFIREKYFSTDNDFIIIKKEIKKRIEFKFHSLTDNNFFPSQDLIICRNTLIYFTRKLQARIIKGFCDCLDKNGALWLGKAENIFKEYELRFKFIDPINKFFIYGR